MVRLNRLAGLFLLVLAAGAVAAPGAPARPLTLPPEMQPTAGAPARAFDLDCGRRGGDFRTEKGALDPGKLLAYGMQGKPFDKASQSASLGTLDEWLTSRYNLRKPLSIMEAGRGRDAATIIAYLLMNDYVIAAQMAHGAAAKSGAIDAERLGAIGRLVNTATQADEDDEELLDIDSKLKQAKAIIDSMPAALRAPATWMTRGYAFDDNVAIDTSMAAFCASRPTVADIQKLREAVLKARLFRPQAGTAPPGATPSR